MPPSLRRAGLLLALASPLAGCVASVSGPAGPRATGTATASRDTGSAGYPVFDGTRARIEARVAASDAGAAHYPVFRGAPARIEASLPTLDTGSQQYPNHAGAPAGFGPLPLPASP